MTSEKPNKIIIRTLTARIVQLEAALDLEMDFRVKAENELVTAKKKIETLEAAAREPKMARMVEK